MKSSGSVLICFSSTLFASMWLGLVCPWTKNRIDLTTFLLISLFASVHLPVYCY